MRNYCKTLLRFGGCVLSQRNPAFSVLQHLSCPGQLLPFSAEDPIVELLQKEKLF